MAQDKVTLFNLALSAVGSNSLISSPDELSPEAEQCRLWYPFVRDQVFRAARWTTGKAVRRLSQKAIRGEESWVATDPLPGWLYVYGAPQDMLYPRFISDYSMFETMVMDDAWTIHTNKVSPILVYTRRQESIGVWESQLFMAIVYALAAHICMPINAKTARGRAALERANDMILAAQVSSANEEQFHLDSMPEAYIARGFARNDVQRYLYPTGPLLSYTGAGLD